MKRIVLSLSQVIFFTTFSAIFLSLISLSYANQSPQFVGLTDKTVQPGKLCQFVVKVKDADTANDLLQVSTEGHDCTAYTCNLPSGARFDAYTRVFSWTPTENDRGDHKISFTVTDGENEASQEIFINVGKIKTTEFAKPRLGMELKQVSGLKMLFSVEKSPFYTLTDLTMQELPETSLIPKYYTVHNINIIANKMAWVKMLGTRPGGGTAVYNWTTGYYDFDSGETKVVPKEWKGFEEDYYNNMILYPQAYGDRIFWGQSVFVGYGEIVHPNKMAIHDVVWKFYDFKTKKEVAITKPFNKYRDDIQEFIAWSWVGSARWPCIFGDKVAWIDLRNSHRVSYPYYDVYFYDIATEKEIRVTNKVPVENNCIPPFDKNLWMDKDSLYYFSRHDIPIKDGISKFNYVLHKYTFAIQKDIAIDGPWNKLISDYRDSITFEISEGVIFCLYSHAIPIPDSNGTYSIDLYAYDMNTGEWKLLRKHCDNSPGNSIRMFVVSGKTVFFDHYDDNPTITALQLSYPPKITSVQPAQGVPGRVLTIEGQDFGCWQREGQVKFQNGAVCEIASWGNNFIRCRIPAGAETGEIKVYTDTGTSNGIKIETASDNLPLKPTNLSASAITERKVKLTWQDNSNNENRFIILRENLSLGERSFIPVATVGSSKITYTDNSVSAKSVYRYRVASSLSGEIMPQCTSLATDIQTSLGTVPNAPTDLSATVVLAKKVNLSWKDNSDNENKFIIRRKNLSAGEKWFTTIATVGKNVKNYSDTTVTLGVLYRYRVYSSFDDTVFDLCSSNRADIKP